MVADFAKRFGLGAVAVALGALIEYLPAFADPANLVEFGVLAGVVGAIFGFVIPPLIKLRDKALAELG